MKQYNYFVTYTWSDRSIGKQNPRTTPLTVHDPKGNMIAAEIMREIQSRVEEMEQAQEYNMAIEIVAVNLLNQINF